jgi:phosphoglycerol transferase MdoB-like AlkP superfamily enzyme
VIVMVESLSASFMGEFGNTERLTPNLDALAGESLFFRNLYATGTRTDRGLEAVILSVPPTPGRCIVKRPIHDNPYSLGQIFRGRGYDTKFIFGGDGTFDNMNEFFRRNAFAPIDGRGFAKREVTFANVWGACDGDVFNRALKECDASAARGRPFCSVLVTTSNHQPFTCPQKIDVASARCRSGSVKYTDEAIGEFLANARTKGWFDDTVFVFVADHCANAAGRAEMELRGYHIPLFIYAPSIVKPARVETLASQIDVAPTLLGLLNFSYRSRFFGRDLLGPGEPRAFVANYQDLGLLQDGRLAVLVPERRFRIYRVDPDGLQAESAPDPRLLMHAVCYYQSAAAFIRSQLEAPEPPGLFTRLVNPLEAAKEPGESKAKGDR